VTTPSLRNPAARPRAERVPILMYHDVDPAPDPRFEEYTVTPAAFEAQMRWLVRAGFQAVTPADLAAARAGGPALPSRPVVITFDDGFRAAVRHAVPVLAAHGMRAVFYLVAGLPGEPSRWMVPELGVELPLIDWTEARALEKDGFVCGSHTLTHPRLAFLPEDECRRELEESRRRLEDALGHAVTDLAYPFGCYDERVVAAAAEAGYVTACTTVEGLSRGEPLLRLRRVGVRGDDSLLDFRVRVRTGKSPREWWDGARAVLRGEA
jgi:peptidoglycan/xylan/chitin deacetylase (PgdA/CDA1 family)